MRWQIDNEPGVFTNVVDADTLDGVHCQHLLEQVTHLVKKNSQKVKIKSVSSRSTYVDDHLKLGTQGNINSVAFLYTDALQSYILQHLLGQPDDSRKTLSGNINDNYGITLQQQ